MPRLVIRKGVGAGTDHALASPCVVGRHASATFVLGDQLVSRNHFRVISEGGAWFVEDLGSTNGTVVNGRRVTKQQLADGDVLHVGNTELQFVQKDLLAAGRPAAPVAARPATPPAPGVGTVTQAGVPLSPKPVAPKPVAPAAVPAKPVLPAKPVVPAAPAVPKEAARPAVPAKPVVPAPAPPTAGPPAAPAKPAVQAPIPRRHRR